MLSQELRVRQFFVTGALPQDLGVDGRGSTLLTLHWVCTLCVICTLGVKFCSAAVTGAVSTDAEISPRFFQGVKDLHLVSKQRVERAESWKEGLQPASLLPFCRA